MERKRRISKEDIQFEKASTYGGGVGYSFGAPNITMKTKGLKSGSSKALLKPHWDWGSKNIQIAIFEMIQKEFLELESTKEKIAEIINREDSRYGNKVEGDD